MGLIPPPPPRPPGPRVVGDNSFWPKRWANIVTPPPCRPKPAKLYRCHYCGTLRRDVTARCPSCSATKVS